MPRCFQIDHNVIAFQTGSADAATISLELFDVALLATAIAADRPSTREFPRLEQLDLKFTG